MCNVDCLKWASEQVSLEDVQGKKVIEVGSYDVNGSLRYIISALKPALYTGIDLVSGPGVDVVCPAEKAVDMFGKESFDIVVSTCVFEHTEDWRSYVSSLKNLCRTKGTILLVVPSRWDYHEYPRDFWRISLEDIKEIFSDYQIETIQEDKGWPALVYAKLIKPEKFMEKDLSGYKLYSVITGNKELVVSPGDLKTLRFHFLRIAGRVKQLIDTLSSKVFWLFRN